MAETPSVYDLEFQDVYDLEFEDVPSEAPELVALDTPNDPSLNDGESLSTLRDAFDAEGNLVLQALPEPAQEFRVSEVVRKLAGKAVGVGLAGSFALKGQDFSPMSAFRLMASLDPEERTAITRKREFNQALLEDDRLICIGGLYYAASPELDPDVYWPYDKHEVDSAYLDELVGVVLQNANAQRVTQKSILGIVSGQGYKLSKDEIHELYAAVTSSPYVTPQENGDYVIHSVAEKNKQDETEKPSKKIFTDGETIIIHRSLAKMLRASRARATGMKKRNYQTRTRGKNGVNIGELYHWPKLDEKTCLDPENDPRRRQPRSEEAVDYFAKPKTKQSSAKASNKLGSTTVTSLGKGKRKRSQGRSHGKKVSFEQLLSTTTQQ